jgi:hypothetical protein
MMNLTLGLELEEGNPTASSQQRLTIETMTPSVGSKSTIKADFEFPEPFVTDLRNFLFRMPQHVLKRLLICETQPDGVPGDGHNYIDATISIDLGTPGTSAEEFITTLDSELAVIRQDIIRAWNSK